MGKSTVNSLAKERQHQEIYYNWFQKRNLVRCFKFTHGIQMRLFNLETTGPLPGNNAHSWINFSCFTNLLKMVVSSCLIGGLLEYTTLQVAHMFGHQGHMDKNEHLLITTTKDHPKADRLLSIMQWWKTFLIWGGEGKFCNQLISLPGKLQGLGSVFLNANPLKVFRLNFLEDEGTKSSLWFIYIRRLLTFLKRRWKLGLFFAQMPLPDSDMCRKQFPTELVGTALRGIEALLFLLIRKNMTLSALPLF